MRQRRCPRILLVDDYLSTSGRLARMLADLQRYRWLRSWKSFRWLTIHAAVYCASEDGADELGSRFTHFLDGISFQRRPRWGLSRWSIAQSRRVASLLERYSRVAGIDAHRLGYREGLGTLVLPTGCSSISPPLLWMRTAHWEPLFPDRSIPEDIQVALGVTQGRRRIAIPNRSGGSARPAAGTPASPSHAPLDDRTAAVLRAAGRGLRRLDSVASWAGLSMTESQLALEQCRTLGLLDGDGRLTRTGKKELRADRALEGSGSQRFAADTTERFYYPSLLRGAKVPSSGGPG
jgi:hypothetical protein